MSEKLSTLEQPDTILFTREGTRSSATFSANYIKDGISTPINFSIKDLNLNSDDLRRMWDVTITIGEDAPIMGKMEFVEIVVFVLGNIRKKFDHHNLKIKCDMHFVEPPRHISTIPFNPRRK